jgi:hypothetical protein
MADKRAAGAIAPQIFHQSAAICRFRATPRRHLRKRAKNEG